MQNLIGRREAIKDTVLAVFLARLTSWAPRLLYLAPAAGLAEMAISCNTVLTILEDADFAIDGVGPIVSLVDPALAPVIAGFTKSFDTEVTAAEGYYNAYEAALKANGATTQTLHTEFLASLTALKETASQLLGAAHVSNPTHQSVLTEIIDEVIQEVLNLVAMFTPAATAQAVPVKVMAQQLKTEHENFRQKMYAIYAKDTGDPVLNKQLQASARKMK